MLGAISSGKAQRYHLPQIFNLGAHWGGCGGGGGGAPDGFRGCVVIHLTLAAAPEIRPAGDKQASGGRSPWKSLFIPPHTKTGLLKLTHNKCFLSGGQGWNYRDVPHCLRSDRSFIPSCLCVFSRLLPFLFKKKSVLLFFILSQLANQVTSRHLSQPSSAKFAPPTPKPLQPVPPNASVRTGSSARFRIHRHRPALVTDLLKYTCSYRPHFLYIPL